MKQTVEGITSGARGGGRPRTTWMDNVKQCSRIHLADINSKRRQERVALHGSQPLLRETALEEQKNAATTPGPA